MQTFFKRLQQIIENQGFKNLNDFALNGLNYDSSSKLNRLKDEKNKPSVEILTDIANKFKIINLHWLITGEGSMLLNEDKLHIVEEPVATYLATKNESYDLLVKNYNLLKEQNALQEELINMLKEKVEDCQHEKKLLATIKKMD